MLQLKSVLKTWFASFKSHGRLCPKCGQARRPWRDNSWACLSCDLVPSPKASIDETSADMHCEAMMFSDRADCTYPQCGCTPRASRAFAN